MMNQDQYHASLLNKNRPTGVGWGGVTKATKFKAMPAEPPNDTDAEESIKKLSSDDGTCKDLNFNNIRVRLVFRFWSNLDTNLFFLFQNISDDQLKRLFKALESNTKLEYLSMANTGISDRLLDELCSAISINSTLKTLK